MSGISEKTAVEQAAKAGATVKGTALIKKEALTLIYVNAMMERRLFHV
jgi:hypothetical protein